MSYNFNFSLLTPLMPKSSPCLINEISASLNLACDACNMESQKKEREEGGKGKKCLTNDMEKRK